MTASAEPTRRCEPVRFSYDEFVLYTEMHPEGDFELLDGVIYRLAPEGKSHKLTRLKIDTYLHGIVDLTKYTVGTEASFAAPGWNEGPKPDNFVSRGALDMNDEDPNEPTSADMLLIIEITNARTADGDRELKRKLTTYARVAIPDYWLIDLVRASVIVHREPSGEVEEPSFASIQRFGRGETIAAACVDSLVMSTDFLLKLAHKN
jgi:Uma2 family endonuclease